MGVAAAAQGPGLGLCPRQQLSCVIDRVPHLTADMPQEMSLQAVTTAVRRAAQLAVSGELWASYVAGQLLNRVLTRTGFAGSREELHA